MLTSIKGLQMYHIHETWYSHIMPGKHDEMHVTRFQMCFRDFAQFCLHLDSVMRSFACMAYEKYAIIEKKTIRKQSVQPMNPKCLSEVVCFDRMIFVSSTSRVSA